MQQPGRKSAASLSVIAGSIDGRPKAPSELTKEQQEVWDRVVAAEPSDWFKTAAGQQMLAMYCRHFATAAKLDGIIQDAWDDEETTPAQVDRLLKMRDRETRACVTLATKLRLTNQSRYTAEKAGTAGRKEASENKPWQRRA
jgi:phage terminase small subunit